MNNIQAIRSRNVFITWPLGVCVLIDSTEEISTGAIVSQDSTASAELKGLNRQLATRTCSAGWLKGTLDLNKKTDMCQAKWSCSTWPDTFSSWLEKSFSGRQSYFDAKRQEGRVSKAAWGCGLSRPITSFQAILSRASCTYN